MNFWDIDRWSGKVLAIDYKTQRKWFSDEIASYVSELTQILSSETKKKLIFIFCRNNIESLIIYLSGLKSKHTLLLLNPELDPEIISSFIDRYQPHYLFSPEEQVSGKNFELLHKILGYNLYKVDYKEKGGVIIHPELALLLTTSGSTGSPKCVRLSYKNITSNADSIATYLNLTQKERPITTLPMYYSYGLSIINSHLTVGATLLLCDEPIAQRGFWSFMNQHKATSLAGVPYIYEVLKRMDLAKNAPCTLKTLTQAGGKINRNTAEYFYNLCLEYNWKFYIMYGQTEATARISYLPFNEMQGRYESIGKAVPGGRIVVDDNTSELIYFGPNVMMGYAMQYHDLGLGDDNKGVLHTGDLAGIDGDGFYYIKGRLKRFIKIAGLRFNLDVIEDKLRNHFLGDMYCCGQDEKLIIFKTVSVSDQLLKEFMMRFFRIHHQFIKMQSISDPPLNANGKVDYNALMERVE